MDDFCAARTDEIPALLWPNFAPPYTLGKKAEESRKVMDRWGTPEDIAPVVVFLLSDMTPWIRGVNIPVDGGQVANVLCNMNGL